MSLLTLILQIFSNKLYYTEYSESTVDVTFLYVYKWIKIFHIRNSSVRAVQWYGLKNKLPLYIENTV